MSRYLAGLGIVIVAATSWAAERAAATAGSPDRGREAVRGRPALNPPVCSADAYEALWKRWGLAEKPADYARAVRDRYGFSPAPDDNGGLPMGFHKTEGLLGRGVASDCLFCHAGTVAGRTV